MGFFDDVVRNIDSFFNVKKKEDEKKNQPVVIKQPTPSIVPPQQTLGGVKMPASLILPTAPQPAPKLAPKQPERNLLDQLGDFAAQANDALYGGITRTGANIANSVATGFNPEETAKRTEDFMRTVGQSNENGQSQLAKNTNKNSTAGRLGQAIGGTEKMATDIVTTLLPGVAAENAIANAPKIANWLNTGNKAQQVLKSTVPVVGGGVASSLTAQALDPTQNVGENFGTGAALDFGLGVLGPTVSQIARRLNLGETSVGLAKDANGAATAIKVAEDTSIKRPNEAPTLETPTQPNNPITVAPPTNKAPAITSPNQPVMPPGVTPPAIPTPPTVAPTRMPVPPTQPLNVAPDPFVSAPIAPPRTPDEDTAAIQELIDQATVKPPVQQVPVDVTPAEAPIVTQARLAAADTPVGNPEAIADAVQAERAADAPTEAIADDLGKIAQKSVQSGEKLDDAGWENLATRIGETANAQAAKIGTDVSSIIEKVQRAYESGGKIKSAKQAGLSEAEFDLYKKMTNEMDYLRSRANPSLVTGGTIGKWYSPRQAVDTEFDPSLINEQARGSGSGRVDAGDLDLTTTPIEQYIRRYGNAENVVKESIINTVENTLVKNADGTDRLIPSGIKVPENIKTRLETGAKSYIAKKDQVEQALAMPDISVKQIDNLTKQMDDDIDATFKELIDSIPANSAEGKEAIARLTAQRGAYMQSTIRSNMFSNVVNRAMDQVGKGIVQSTNQLVDIADSASALLTGSKALSTGRAARSVARQYSRGALRKQIAKDFNTNMTFAGTSAGSKADVAYRAGSTSLTSAGDLTTTIVKTANRAMLARAQAEGITKRADLEKYLRENINSAEYKELLTGIQNVYAGYVSLPASVGSRIGNAGSRLSKLDNAIVNSQALKNAGVSPRIRRELNDLIMPAVTGFAGATFRVGAKSLNAAALGVPGIVKGLRIAKEGGEASRQIGQLMMARSLVDGVVGGTAAAATVGAMVANVAEWTGEYPTDDPAEAARWEKDGIVPNSLSFDLGNGEKLQIQPGRLLGAFALPVVLPAVIKSGGDAQQVIDATMGQMLDNLGANSILETVKNVSTAATEDGFKKDAAIKKLLSSAGFSLSAAVPLAGAMNNVANATDDVKRDTSGGVVDVIKNRIPGARQTLDTKKDNLGNDIRNNTQVSLGSQAATIARNGSGTAANADPLNDEITRLAGADFEVMPGKDVKNTNSTNDAKTLLESDLYQSGTDEEKAEYLKKTLLGTEFKDISKDLTDSTRSTLIEYKLQGENERKAWLEDNDNAANYYRADYDNANANDTLTKKDKNLQEKEGKLYKAVRAEVNKKVKADYELTSTYDKISQSDLKNLLDPESEDYDTALAEKLVAYDEARTKAGVSGAKFTDKNKYDVEKALKSIAKGSGRGGRGSTNFAFASLPASLVGNNASSGSKDYADGAPTFQPMADLKAPATVAIPKGRSISVTRGTKV